MKDQNIGHTPAMAEQGTDPAADYPRFHAAVALAQLTSWLPEAPQFLVDISGRGARAAEVAARAGHSVLRVIDPGALPPKATATATVATATTTATTAGVPGGFCLGPPGELGGRRGGWGTPGGMGGGSPLCEGSAPHPGSQPPMRGVSGGPSPGNEHCLATVVADGTGLEFLADGCADGVIAENGTLSMRLAAEELVAEIARVLRPGGRVLACVDSLTFGMAVLAEQHRWPHLVDVPNADVVLIPWPDGTMTRCYGAEQLRELFTGCGLEVSWIRPRTVFSPQTVSYLLARDPGRFGELVNAELRARSDDSVGTQLITCAVRR